MSAKPPFDPAGAGWTEIEYVARGAAASFTATELPSDGRFVLQPDASAPYATRVLVRRPADPAGWSGTLVVEWLNVSSGADAAPDWTYLSEELVRAGHAWAGVSAQLIGVEGGDAAVPAGGGAGGALKGTDPERYGDLDHPGDAFAYDVFTQVARGLSDDLTATCVLAVGESQSAYALTTYVNGVQPLETLFDGILVHSRGGSAMPLGEAGRGIDLAGRTGGPATRIRDDLDTPVIVVQTETDLFGRMDYLPARQPDSAYLRLWEIAGTAHADYFQIGDLESFLGCPDPVNRGQQVYVLRAALRHLETWARGGPAAPIAPRLDTRDGRLVLDPVGNATGGVRTPVVEAPTEVLSGFAGPEASVICSLFGRTLALAPDQLRALHPTRTDYLAAYTHATDTAIAAGFMLSEDRDAVLGEARTHLLPD